MALFCFVCLIVGIVMNIPVAMVLTVLAQWRSDSARTIAQDDCDAVMERFPDFPVYRGCYGAQLHLLGYREWNIGTIAVERVGDPPEYQPLTAGTGTRTFISIEAGWPFAALRHDETYRVEAQAWMREYMGAPQPAVMSEDSNSIIWPTQLMWAGLVKNALIYAVLLWLLILLPWMIRRSIRARRGLCPSCAYPVGAGAICTECGGRAPPIAQRIAAQRCEGQQGDGRSM